MRIKVDKIASVEEAAFFSGRNEVEFLTVKLALENSVEDSRSINVSEAKAIKNKLGKKNKLGVYIDKLFDVGELTGVFEEKNFEFVSLNSSFLSCLSKEKEDELMDYFRQEKVFVFQHAISANYDDDPSWIKSKIDEGKKSGVNFHQIEIYNEIEYSWSELSSNLREDELIIPDFLPILNDSSIFYSLDFHPSNILEVIKTLKSSNISFTLKNEENHSSLVHLHSFSEVVKCLEEVF